VSRVQAGLGWLAGERARRGVELFVLTGLVVTQPLLQAIGKAPDFLVLHRLGRLDILALVAAVTFLPALGLWTVGLIAGLAGERVGRWAQLGMVGALGTLLGVEAGKQALPLRGAPLLLIAGASGVGIGWLYRRRGWLRLWLRYLAPAPLVFALLFVTTSPSGRLLQASSATPRAGQPAAGNAARPPVVLVFFDEFPLQSLLDSGGRIDRRVYPNLARVAAQATWYRNATGVSGFTQWAVPAMLTGRYPSKVKAPIAEQYSDNLFTLFGQTYNLKVDELVTRLCPVERCAPGGAADPADAAAVLGDTARLLGQVVSPYDHDVDPAGIAGRPAALTPQGGVPGSDQAARWAKFLASIQRTDPQPTLYFEHVLLPHGPWQYLPDGTRYPPDSYGLKLKETQYGQGVWDTNHQRHLLQLAFVDHLVGQLVQRLKQQGLWDRALVVLTADHGNGFSAGETARRLGNDNAASLMWVPLLIKAAHQTTGRVDDRNWEQVDLLPTLADLVGVPVPWPVDGFSQTGPPRRHATEKVWYDIPGRRQVRDGPADFARVLAGVTDTLVHGEQGQPGLYHYGPTGDWIEQPPQAVGQVADPEVSPPTAKLTNWTRATTADPASGRVPALLVGRLTSKAPPDDARVVVAVNGRIGAVAELFADRPGAKPANFAAILPDFLFRPGPAGPQVELFLLEGSDNPILLQPISLRG
jgi:sulfatase-like protein